jgi:cytochrome b561
MGMPRFRRKGLVKGPVQQSSEVFMVEKVGGTYTRTARWLHWLILGLLIAQFIFAWTMPHIGRDTPVTTLISLHFTFGVIILAAVIVRLVWRVTHGEPEPEDGIPP